jgi:hypothetical protein
MPRSGRHFLHGPKNLPDYVPGVSLSREIPGDLANADVCQIAPEVLASIASLLESHPFRALDAIHVACALACKPDVFLSANPRQLSAVRASGLKIADVS